MSLFDLSGHHKLIFFALVEVFHRQVLSEIILQSVDLDFFCGSYRRLRIAEVSHPAAGPLVLGKNIVFGFCEAAIEKELVLLLLLGFSNQFQQMLAFLLVKIRLERSSALQIGECYTSKRLSFKLQGDDSHLVLGCLRQVYISEVVVHA